MKKWELNFNHLWVVLVSLPALSFNLLFTLFTYDGLLIEASNSFILQYALIINTIFWLILLAWVGFLSFRKRKIWIRLIIIIGYGIISFIFQNLVFEALDIQVWY